MLFNSSPSIGGCNVIPWCYNAWLRIIIIIQPALNEDGGEVGSGRGPGSKPFAQPRAFAIGMENTKELSHKWRDMETCCISPHPSNEKTDTLVSDEYLIRRGIFLQTLLLIHFSGTHLHIPRAECVLHWKESPRRIRKLSPYSIAMPCRRIFQLIRVWLNVFTNTFSRCGCTYYYHPDERDWKSNLQRHGTTISADTCRLCKYPGTLSAKFV